MKNRIILHIDMDAFFAEIEERENPQFKGKPIVVGADPKVRAAPEGGELRPTGRGVVSTANYTARKYGIHSAMPISVAWRLCPQAIFLPVNMELYQKVSEKIMEIIKKYGAIFEQVSLDEAYLDLSPLFTRSRGQGLYREAKELAGKLKKEIFEKEKLPSTVGIGPNKLIAKMATNEAKPPHRWDTFKSSCRAQCPIWCGGKPNGLLIIKANQVKNFLDPLDIEKIPGIGPKTAERLRKFGVNKIKELRKLSKSKLQKLFGKVGETIYEKAQGIDEAPVTPEEIVKSIGREHTFEKDTRNSEIIFATFDKIIESVHRELKENDFSFRTLTVICRFRGFETHTKSKTLEKPTQDFELLKKESKKLLLKFLIESPKPIRLVGLRISNLS
jgi:DNA polymerase IV (DinB-like DNA polymerase)